MTGDDRSAFLSPMVAKRQFRGPAILQLINILTSARKKNKKK
jgi:hypothetical protein